MRPVIIVTPSITNDEDFIKINRAYTVSVERAGGISVIPDYYSVESIGELMAIADGVLLTGGVDIDPSFYGEPPKPGLGEVTPLRDVYELEMVNRAVKLKKPILGICRGAQIINVAFGGKLYQDIYSQVENPIKHSQDIPKRHPSHSVRLVDNSVIKAVAGGHEIRVNSTHHQAVSELGDCLRATAKASDGVIEAIEHTELPFCMGIQWHPEHMNEPEQFEIFAQFIRFARYGRSA